MLEVNKEQNLGARRLEKIEFRHGRHIPHNAIHKVLLHHGLANVNRNKSKRRKPGSDTNVSTACPWCIWIGMPATMRERRSKKLLRLWVMRFLASSIEEGRWLAVNTEAPATMKKTGSPTILKAGNTGWGARPYCVGRGLIEKPYSKSHEK